MNKVITFCIDIVKSYPFEGSCYSDLSPRLKAKQAIMNIKNRDNECFRWALRAWKFPFHQGGHSDRPSKYPGEDGFDFSGIDFPVKLNQIPKIDQQNNLAINVFAWGENRVLRVYASEQPEGLERINLMLITNERRNSLYCFVKNLSHLLHPKKIHAYPLPLRRLLAKLLQSRKSKRT